MCVEDEDFVDCMNAALDGEHCTAERAVQLAGEQFAAMLAAMGDAYMQAGAAGIKDVARRILNNLMGVAEGGIDELSVSPSTVLPLQAEIRKSIAKTRTLEKLEC